MIRLGRPLRARWRLAVATLTLAAAATAALAHDFLLRPATFVVDEGGSIRIALLIGHGGDRQRWQTDSRRILRFEGRSEAGAADYLGAVGGRSTDADQPIDLAGTGTHVILFESSPARSELSGDRFEAYLREEGLTLAQETRRLEGTTLAPGRELYSRRAKALIQIGPRAQRDASHVVLPHGQTLEIVTEANPYATAAGQPLPVRIFYNGRPLPGALVKLWKLNGDAVPTAAARTDGAGRAEFVRPAAGEWQFGVVWTRPIPTGTWAQFETVFASLTFGTAS